MKLEKLAHFQSELTFLVKRSPGHLGAYRYPVTSSRQQPLVDSKW